MPLSVSLSNDHGDPVFESLGLAGFKSRDNAFLLSRDNLPFLFVSYFPFLPSMGWLCGVGVFGFIVFSLSLDLALLTLFKNNNK